VIIGFYGKKAILRRRSGGQTILAGPLVLLLCLIGLAGCVSSSSSSNSDSGSTIAGAQPSGCFLSSIMRPNRKSPTAKHPVLASARLVSYEVPLPIIPRPEYNFDEVRPAGEDEQRQADWADRGLEYERSHSGEMAGSLSSTQENLLAESDAITSREETALFTDDLNSGDVAGYGAEICRAIAGLDTFISNLNDLNQVVSYLQQLAANDGSQAPNDLASVVEDSFNQFEQAFGSCINDLNSTQWIIQTIQTVFCGGELPGGAYRLHALVSR
jgi:hypothetical protein